ncbi:Wzz/FepE/Etk N-terminal domain-containing protein [Marinobacteraceae bacterium S3BR75-40.1]
MTQPSPSSQQEFERTNDDEISLVDLARVLIEQKWWVMGVWALVTLGALLFALSKEPTYRYTTDLLIGEFGQNQLVSEPSATQGELENRYLPKAEMALLEKTGLEGVPFKTQIEVPKNSSFVQVQTDTTEEMSKILPDFHRSLLEPVVEDQNNTIDLLVKQSDNKLDTLRGSLKAKQVQLERLLALKESLMSKQANKEVGAPEVKAEGNAGRLRPTISSDEQGLALLLSDLQINQDVGGLESAINNLEGDIQAEELKRAWSKRARIDGVALRSQSPVGTGKKIIVMLGVVLGGMLGIFAAFVAHFVTNVRKLARESR